MPLRRGLRAYRPPSRDNCRTLGQPSDLPDGRSQAEGDRGLFLLSFRKPLRHKVLPSAYQSRKTGDGSAKRLIIRKGVEISDSDYCSLYALIWSGPVMTA